MQIFICNTLPMQTNTDLLKCEEDIGEESAWVYKNFENPLLI